MKIIKMMFKLLGKAFDSVALIGVDKKFLSEIRDEAIANGEDGNKAVDDYINWHNANINS
ncbi:hypothetical protein AB0996_01030 [Weissella confusa]|uniref:hypothetical protein n=1 Tax=Weissella confusa TaxID=1583 RepID=UPI0034565C29